MSIEPPNPQQMDPTLALVMQLFGGVPQNLSYDEDGAYQDPMDPLNDALDTTQNLYSTLGFNLQDLILPPEAPPQWVNDVGTMYGQSPLYSMIFADIEDGVDPITAVQNVMRAASPVDAEGNPLEPGDRNVARYVVADPDTGELLDVPTKIWNQQDATGVSTPQIQLDLDALQGVAKDYATSMAEGRRFQAEQPDMGVYTALDMAGGQEAINAMKVAYGLRSGGDTLREAQRIAEIRDPESAARQAEANKKVGAFPEMPVFAKGYDTKDLKEMNDYSQTAADGSTIRPANVVDMSSLQGMGAGARRMVPDPRALLDGFQQDPDHKTKRARRQDPKASERQSRNLRSRQDSFNSTMDKLVARGGGRRINGKDRQRQLDALSAVLALPQIINGR